MSHYRWPGIVHQLVGVAVGSLIVILGAGLFAGPASAVQATGSISGTIAWPTGTVQPGTEVYVSANGPVAIPNNQAIVEPDGSYTITGLPVGEYKLVMGDSNDVYYTQWHGGDSYATAEQVIVTAGADTIVNFDARQMGSISGKITDPLSPELQWQVRVRAIRVADGASGNPLEVNRDGTYTLWGLTEGLYKVQVMDWENFYLDEYYGESMTLAGARDITVTDGVSVTGIDVALDRSTVATGKFVGPGGAPIDDRSTWMMVYAYDEAGFNVGGARSATDHSFRLAELPTGRYRLVYFDSGCHYGTSYYNGASEFSTSDLIDIERGSVVDLGNIELARHEGGCQPDQLQAPVVRMSATTVSASWLANNQEGSPSATGYAVTSLPAGAGCTTTGATSCVVTGMTPGVYYRLFVFATNAEGRSLPGQPSEIVRGPQPLTPSTPAPPTKPAAPSREFIGKKQNVAKKPTRLQKGEAKKLPVRSSAGVKLVWKSLTPVRCSIRNGKVEARRKGTCRLRVSAASRGHWLRYESAHVVRIR